MKELDIKQRSEEWHEFRRGKIGGSKAKEYSSPRHVLKDELVKFAQEKGYEFPKTLTIAKIRELLTPEELAELDYRVELNDSIYKLIAEELAREITPNDYTERLEGQPFSMMARGTLLEAEALEMTAERLEKTIEPGNVWLSDISDRIYVSPDGMIRSEDGIIREAVEVKCLDNWKVVKAYYEKRPPAEYDRQIVQYFVVNPDLETLYFAIYSDAFAAAPKLELQIFRMERADLEGEIKESTYMQQAVVALVEQEVTNIAF